MDNKLITMVITLTVCIIVTGSVLMPVLEDTTATEDTFENDGYYHLTKYTAEDSVTMTWDASAPDVFTVNGEDVTYHNDNSFAVSVGLGERFAVRLPTNNTAINFYGAGTYINTNTTNTTFTLTYSEGTLTVTNGTNTKSISDVSEIFVISSDGDYVMKKTDSPAYLNSGSEIVADSEIYASGQTFNGGAYIFWHLQGSIEDMEYPDTFDSNLTITNETIHGKYDTAHEDLYVLDNLTFTATTSTSVVYNVTASYFVVPSEVTAERSQHLDGNEIALISVIPVLIIAALLIFAVRVFLSNRD